MSHYSKGYCQVKDRLDPSEDISNKHEVFSIRKIKFYELCEKLIQYMDSKKGL